MPEHWPARVAPDRWSEVTGRRYARKLRERAIRYAEHGWPVAPLAVPRYGFCPCRQGDCVDPHLAGEVVRGAGQADAVWSEDPWDIALMTEYFDVVDVPPRFGAPLNHLLKTTCPTAMAPARRRWWFFLVPGSMSPATVAAADGVLHTGPTGWVPAPGTHTDTTGRIRWLTHPYLTHWHPYQRRDPIDQIFEPHQPPLAAMPAPLADHLGRL